MTLCVVVSPAKRPLVGQSWRSHNTLSESHASRHLRAIQSSDAHLVKGVLIRGRLQESKPFLIHPPTCVIITKKPTRFIIREQLPDLKLSDNEPTNCSLL